MRFIQSMPLHTQQLILSLFHTPLVSSNSVRSSNSSDTSNSNLKQHYTEEFNSISYKPFYTAPR